MDIHCYRSGDDGNDDVYQTLLKLMKKGVVMKVSVAGLNYRWSKSNDLVHYQAQVVLTKSKLVLHAVELTIYAVVAVEVVAVKVILFDSKIVMAHALVKKLL